MMKNIIYIIGLWMTSLTAYGQVPYLLTEADVIFIDGEITEYTSAYVDIIIPDYLNGQEVTSIGESAFKSYDITSVVIPNSVTYIGESAFSGNLLTSVDIPTSLKIIGNAAFYDSDLTDVTIPNSVTYIGNNAFQLNNLTSVVIPNSVTYIGGYAFYSNALTEFVLPEPTIDGAWSTGTAGVSTSSLTTTFVYEVTAYTGVDTDFLFEDGEIQDYYGLGGALTIPSTIDGLAVTSIGSYAFKSNSLTSVDIPNSVTFLGESAFEDNNLTSVTIPNSVLFIGESAFEDNNLTSIIIPDVVTFIGESAFEDNNLTSFILPEPSMPGAWNEGTAGASTSSLTSTFVYEATTYTGVDADFLFEDGEIQDYYGPGGELIIPSMIDGQAVTSIGESAFEENNLTSIDIPNSVTSIGESAFKSNNLTSIDIPNSVTSIGLAAFRSNDLTSVSIPNSVTTIEDFAFASNSLTSVTIPNSVISIGTYAFFQNSLTNVTLGNSLIALGTFAFAYNSLASIDLPNSMISIGSYAFYGNTLTEFVLPEPTIPGAWDEGTSGSTVTSLNRSYTYEVTDYTGVDSDFLFEDGEIQDYYGPGGELTIPATIDGQTVTSIGYEAFYNKSLTSVAIPSSVTSIGDFAFRSNSLTSIDIPNAVTSLGRFAFEDNGLISVVIPNSVTFIGANAFQSNSLTSVVISNSLTAIGIAVFKDNNLTDVNIPTSVTQIRANAFYNNSLTSVAIPNSVIYIGGSAFNLNDLTDFVLPEPTATGFVFGGWISTGDISYTLGETTSDLENAYSLVVSEDNSAVVSVLLDGSTGDLSVSGDMTIGFTDISSANFTVEQGIDIILTPEIDELGYGFIPQSVSFTDIQESINQVFTYGLLTYSISYEVDGGTHDNPVTYTIESDEITLSAAAREGYEFVGWYTEAEFTNQVSSIAAGSTGDVTVYAQWEEEESEGGEETEDEEEVLLIENDLAGVMIYPNPSVTGLFYIDLPEGASSTIRVFDTSGHLVVDQKSSLGTDLTEVKVSLGTGMYLLHVSSAGKIFRQKIIIR